MSGTRGATGVDADNLSLVDAGSALRRGDVTRTLSVRSAVSSEGERRGEALVATDGSLSVSRLLGGRRSSFSWIRGKTGGSRWYRLKTNERTVVVTEHENTNDGTD